MRENATSEFRQLESHFRQNQIIVEMLFENLDHHQRLHVYIVSI